MYLVGGGWGCVGGWWWSIFFLFLSFPFLPLSSYASFYSGSHNVGGFSVVGHFGETPPLTRWLEEEKGMRKQYRESGKKPLETKESVSRGKVGGRD